MMEDNTDLLLLQMLRALGPGFCRWYPLGIFLGISSQQLDAIRANEHDVQTQCCKMLEQWYTSKTPTWRALCEALRDAGHLSLADRISVQYCRVSQQEVQQPTSAAPLSEPPHPPAPIEGGEVVTNDPQAGLPRIPVDEDTRIQVLDDQEKCDISVAFAVMFAIVVRSLSKKVDVDTIKTFLRSFRCHITMKPYVSPDLYKHCKTTSEVLLSLEPVLINAMHPYLLRKIIENFGCEESRQAVREYDAKFPRTIALQNLGDPVPDWMIAACHGAKKIVVVVKGESDTITRGDVEDVQIALERDLEVERVFIVFAKHEERNSVGLTFLVPECVSVLSSLRNDGQKLMNLAASGITRIEADGDTIEVDVEAKLWMHRMMRMKGKRSDELSVDSGVDSRGGSIVSSRRSSFSEDSVIGDIPPSASSRDHQLAMEFADNLRTNRTASYREFYRATITDEAATAIGSALMGNKSLRKLQLKHCNISTTGLSSLASALSTNTSLKELRLYNCKVCDSVVEALAAALSHNNTLEILDLSNPFGSTNRNTITSKGCSALARSLRQNKSLKDLDLLDNNISDQGVCELSETLLQNSTLETLELSDNQISSLGASALATSLKRNSSLKRLSLSGNSISDKGVTSLADALRQNNSLLSLNLQYNSISDEGVTSLAEALRHNSSLLRLHLSGNSISDQGVTSLADALRHNSSLHYLDLQYNSISDEGVTSLADALRHNSSLHYLDLSLGDVTDSGAEQLAIAIEANDTLRTLWLWGSGHISKEIRQRMKDCAKRKGLYVWFH